MFRKACGIARFAYNWGLERNNNIWLYNQLPHPPIRYESPADQHKLLNRRKETDWPWMYEVSKCAPQEALRDLGNAFHNFLKNHDHFKWPRFKARYDDEQSFTLTGAIHVSTRSVQLPTFGLVKLKEREYLPTRNHVLYATVSRKAGRWYVSVGARKRFRVEKNAGPVVGVDWGITHLATVSDGTALERSFRLEQLKWMERHAQKALGRKAKGSRNHVKALLRYQKLWYRITNVKVDGLHKFTTMLARTKSVIVIEDLAATNMAKNHNLAGSIYEATPYELKRQLKYKTRWRGSRLVVAPRGFPSTKMCSRCRHVKDAMPLSERVFRCEECGLVIDRDLNASRNLEWYATASSAGCACLMQEVAVPSGTVPAGEAGRVDSTWSK